MRIDRRGVILSTAGLPLIGSAERASDTGSRAHSSMAISLREAGAELNGLVNDSAALQRAIDAAIEVDPPRPILVEGPCRLERSVYIDRPVDKSRGVLRIVGTGPAAGFIATGSFPLFASRLQQSKAPQSEYVWFQNIRFEAGPAAAQASVMTQQFLRVQFRECEFQGIKALQSDIYAQEWQFTQCIIRSWPGTFFSSRGGYHVTSTGSKFQNGGGTVFNISDPTLADAGCVGCAFHQDIVESNAGSFLKAALVRGLSIAGLYHEGNDGPALDLEHAATNQGVSVTGSMFAPKQSNKQIAAFFDLRWGRIEAGHASGNFSSGNLHLFQPVGASGLTIAGDFAALQLARRII